MTNKLHTSQKTQEIFNSLGQSLRLQPFILSKLAIALSVRKGQLQADDFKTDNNGLELSRQVIFGDHDLLFIALHCFYLCFRTKNNFSSPCFISFFDFIFSLQDPSCWEVRSRNIFHQFFKARLWMIDHIDCAVDHFS